MKISRQVRSQLAAFLRDNRPAFRDLFARHGIPPEEVESLFLEVVSSIPSSDWPTASPGPLLFSRLLDRVQEAQIRKLWGHASALASTLCASAQIPLQETTPPRPSRGLLSSGSAFVEPGEER